MAPSSASPQSIKRELPPDSPLPEEDVPVKRQATEASRVGTQTSSFPWKTCDNVEGVERLRIKEYAVKVAQKHCARLKKELSFSIFEGHADAVVLGQRMLEQWMKEDDDLRKAHENFQILVGVQGPTGAGKSSFLGSLLLQHELLPSGQDGAATAAVGKVSWNYDNTPGHEFRARITFRPLQDISQCIKVLLENIERVMVLEKIFVTEVEDVEERENDIAIAEDTISYELPGVKAVWGLSREDLEGALMQRTEDKSCSDIVRDILNSNQTVLSFLRGGTLDFKTTTRFKLRRAVQPFLDSTPYQHNDGSRFAVWPLVEHVHMYVKSNILKSGMTLVDLPGCSDSTARRAEVTKAFAHQLDVRLVVSPIARASDEEKSQELIQSGFDEAQMKLSGKDDGRGFGIIMTMTDAINVDTYLRTTPTLKFDPGVRANLDKLRKLQGEGADVMSKIQATKLEMSKARAQKAEGMEAYMAIIEKRDSQTDDERRASDELLKKLKNESLNLKRSFEEAQNCLEQLEARDAEIQREEANAKNWLHNASVQVRNWIVEKKIQGKYSAQRSNVPGADTSKPPPPVPIFAVSTNAYWNLIRGAPVVGFATLESTGYPAVKKWLPEATMNKREKHLDAILGRYQKLMNLMRIYSKESSENDESGLTRSSFEAVLEKTHGKFTTISRAGANIQLLNPLKDRDETVKTFSNQAVRIATRWGRKFPNKRSNITKIAAGTYKAIVKRHGRTYESKTKGCSKITYNWLEGLGTPMLQIMGRDWDRDMNKELLKIKVPIMEAFRKVWADYVKELEQVISMELPALEESFSDILTMVSNAEHVCESQVLQLLEELSKETSSVGFDLVDYLEEELEQTFDGAFRIGGQGSHARRCDHIVQKFKRSGEDLCHPVLDRLAKNLETKKKKIPGKLRDIAQSAVEDAKQQISFFINNLIENYETDEASQAKKLELQASIRTHVAKWEQEWEQREGQGEELLGETSDIPEVVGETKIEEDDEETEETDGVVGDFGTVDEIIGGYLDEDESD
ncbi:GTPase SLIP-GC [Fusarium denticulatum]|uniref:GTPase SLIP-GC n=1 Tax=Fusarium denticulatum TaxID=48507 RepID=A0A8H5UA40_9HYPO|nr:GTPase SLIP-GC [Fusarium denticulatum]